MRRAVLALVLLCAAAPAARGESTTVWYKIAAAGGARIGFASEEIVSRAGGRDVVAVQDTRTITPDDRSPSAPLFSVPRALHTVARTVRTEDASGHTVAIVSTVDNGREVTRSEAHITPQGAVVAVTTAAGTRSVTVALPPGVRFDDGDALLVGWNPAVTPRLTFDDFELSALAVDHVTIEAVDGPDDKGRITALRKRYAGGAMVAVSRLIIDRDGHVVGVRQPMFGTDIAIDVTTRTVALDAHAPYRLLLGIMTKSPYRIDNTAAAGHIRYRFTFRDGITFDIPPTGEQRVTAAGGGVTVDVCTVCGAGLPTDAAYLADARKPTAWLQSEAPEIVAIAAPIAKEATTDTRKMEMLTKKAQLYLPRIDFVGHYSALEALTRGAGDCTESATLLAALGRAAGIPTRVVNGLVYSRERYHGVSNVFLPHSWVLAWTDGKWRSFDAALGYFDTTHIALSINDGDQRSAFAAQQFAGLLQWDAMQEVRARPAG